MAGGPGAGEWVKNHAARRTPQLNHLREELERLDGLEPMIVADDGRQLTRPHLRRPRLAVAPADRFELQRLA
jgi:hypothetical protein